MCFDPAGKHLADVHFPARNMACTTWGGAKMDTLYIATGKDRSTRARDNDMGGHMFAFKPPGVRGSAKYEFDG